MPQISSSKVGGRSIVGHRGTMAAAALSTSKEHQQQQLSTGVKGQYMDTTIMPELNLDETVHIRTVFSEFIHEEYVTSTFELRVVLAELGLYPSDEELTFVLDVFDNKMNITNLCHYLRFYKKEFQIFAQQQRGDNSSKSNKNNNSADDGATSYSAQEESEDTLRAFVSLGGSEDGTGSVSVEDLRQVCRNFGLTIDLDAMLNNVLDTESQTTLNYTEFCDMWKSRRRQAEWGSTCSAQTSMAELRMSLRVLGIDYAASAKSGARSDIGSALLMRRASVKDEAAANDLYKFPQSTAGANNSGSTTTTTAAALRSEEAHMQALRRFLQPESFNNSTNTNNNNNNNIGVNFIEPRPNSGGRRKVAGGGRRGSMPSAMFLSTQEAGERRRSLLQASREELMITGENEESGGVPASMRAAKTAPATTTNTTTGGFRAPSPMILSLRNSAAYRRRLQAFAQKTKSKTKQKGNWTRSASIAHDEDAGRN